MDKKTKSVALRLYEIKEELSTILGWALDSDYVTLADERRLIEAIGRLSNLEFIEDIKYSTYLALSKELLDENS